MSFLGELGVPPFLSFSIESTESNGLGRGHLTEE
jgi:hypothetical protein